MQQIWTRFAFLAIACLGLLRPAGAATGPVDLLSADSEAAICVQSASRPGVMIVDRQKLADLLLKNAAFTLAAYHKLKSPAYEKLGESLQILATASTATDICATEASGCGADNTTIGQIKQQIQMMLYSGKPYYETADIGVRSKAMVQVSPEMFFRDQSEKTAPVCLPQTAPRIVPTPVAGGAKAPVTGQTAAGAAGTNDGTTPAASPWDPLRVRGSVDDLLIDHKSPQFPSTSKATVNFNEDGVKKTTTNAITAVVGYGFGNPSIFEAVPYVGINRNIVALQPGSTSKASSAETVDTGVSATWFFQTETDGVKFGHRVNLRPDYLEDTVDNSQILSLSLLYQPVYLRNVDDRLPFWLNTFAPLIPGSGNPIVVEPMLDFRVDGGTYTNRGKTSVAASNIDYLRLGGRAGLTVILPVLERPLTLTSTYTGLFGAQGKVNIGYFANSLSYPFISDIVAITASYTNGNREDTAKREQLWLLGLSLHY